MNLAMKIPHLTKSPAARTGLLYFALSATLPILVYAAVQYTLRQDANDPQIQLAQDGAAILGKGGSPADVVNDSPVDVTASLAPIVIAYQGDGRVAAINGSFGSATPVPPAGTFAYARTHGQNRFTWQPQPGTRLAAVLVYSGDSHPGYVLAARNLREVETRENQVQFASAAVLSALLIFGVVVLVIF